MGRRRKAEYGRQKGTKRTKKRGREAERIGYRIVEEPLMSFAKGRNFGSVRWLIASGVVVVGAR